MALAIFDLDHTLIDGDSDVLWGDFACEYGLVNKHTYQQQNNFFYQQYEEGTLNIIEYMNFIFTAINKFDMNTLLEFRESYINEKIRPIILSGAKELIDAHRQKRDTLLIITATNSFLTTPIAELFGINNLIATEPEIINNKFTGGVVGIPSFQSGKVKRLNNWLEKNTTHSLDFSKFYSDSHNDLPLLEKVDNPVAVNPDPKLKKIALERGWQIIHL